ncbi:uncharacterized protein LOC114933222 isoform X2 [Nylanderia fulva]|uniref:uncharacterized protein LOC114933222 isoform X1 n=1 Tax=Nylanderia fulva TaxID=613905 RepID=UPI0010FAF3FE|nr:uncharacterized protein LOC114933222 isoform X1 [Nylanderia fulva]XP_029161535.1 uncharacterized protein LOC114933222 isoform X2 [Nylanderia fulva]
MCLPLLFKMTPTFCWMFLLACLVGRVASVPQPLLVDACALICNPGAETESERERDTSLYPRYPKVDCKLQSDKDESQAWVITSNCLKLCNVELSISMEVNCFALRSSLGANLGCYCEALTPLSPNTIRLNEDWKMNFLVKELANDLVTTILNSPLDELIICEIHKELLNSTKLAVNKFKVCDPTYGKLEAASLIKEDEGDDKEEESKDKKEEEPEHHISRKRDVSVPSPDAPVNQSEHTAKRRISISDSRPVDEVVTSRDDENEEKEHEKEKKIEVEAEEEKKTQGPTEKEEVKVLLPVNGNPAPEEL